MMKKVMDERIKHRLIGLVVALSLMIIFLPVAMKQSNRRFDEAMTLSMRLPKKPALPQVAVVNKNKMFKTLKVATVTIPAPGHVTTHIAKAMPLQVQTPVEHTSLIASVDLKPHDVVSKPIQAKNHEAFAIQLATFNQQGNADALVKHLRQQGYQASSQVINGATGHLYQVIVGQMKQRDQAIDLQKKLVNNTQLNGLIIKTKVS